MVLICSTLARILYDYAPPFRVAFGTGGEEDNRRIFRLLFDLRQFQRQQMAEDPQLIAGRNVAFQVFKEDPTYL